MEKKILTAERFENEATIKIDKKIEEMTKKANSLSEEINEKKKELIEGKYRPAFDKLCIEYINNSGVKINFDWDSGAIISEVSDDYKVVNVYALKSKRNILVGYDLSNGALIFAEYKIDIDNKAMKMKKKYIRTQCVDFFNHDDFYGNNIAEVKCNKFIQEFFDCNYESRFSICQLSTYHHYNPSFEIIIRSELSNQTKDLLLRKYEQNKKPMPVYTLLGLSKTQYRSIVDNGYLDYYCSAFISMQENYNLRGKLFVPKSEKELLELLEYCMEKEKECKELNIYFLPHFRYEDDDERDGIFYALISSGYNDKNIAKNYTPLKFTKYVGEEALNQGYSDVASFVTELTDYLRMCEHAEMTPNLYGSYLKQTHDLASRNYQIVIDEMSEKIFSKRYAEFKDEKITDDYWVIKPKSSGDLKREGSNLGHCVASYINEVINGRTLIFFLRKDEDKSLVTFEYRNGRIVQERGARNRSTTSGESNAIRKWLEKTKRQIKNKEGEK